MNGFLVGVIVAFICAGISSSTITPCALGATNLKTALYSASTLSMFSFSPMESEALNSEGHIEDTWKVSLRVFSKEVAVSTFAEVQSTRHVSRTCCVKTCVWMQVSSINLYK